MVHFPGLARLTMLGNADNKDGHYVPHDIDMLSSQLQLAITGADNCERPHNFSKLPRLLEVDKDW
jgi:hypothetical protein